MDVEIETSLFGICYSLKEYYIDDIHLDSFIGFIHAYFPSREVNLVWIFPTNLRFIILDSTLF